MLTLRGLTFADGAVVNSEIGDDPDAQPIGGAVRMDDGTLAIESCIFLRNRVDGAEEIIANGRADLVVLGRSMLADPYWPLHAARTLRSSELAWPVQYERADIF